MLVESLVLLILWKGIMDQLIYIHINDLSAMLRTVKDEYVLISFVNVNMKYLSLTLLSRIPRFDWSPKYNIHMEAPTTCAFMIRKSNDLMGELGNPPFFSSIFDFQILVNFMYDIPRVNHLCMNWVQGWANEFMLNLTFLGYLKKSWVDI